MALDIIWGAGAVEEAALSSKATVALRSCPDLRGSMFENEAFGVEWLEI
jgi:hypothetical protein